MRLYRFTLPTNTNAGLSYEFARKQWEGEALRLAGGFTLSNGFDLGVYKGAERVYREPVAQYEVATNKQTRDELLARAFELFPDQEAIFVADLGQASVVLRPAAKAAA